MFPFLILELFKDMENAKRIPAEVYSKVIDMMPILCVDIIIMHQGKIILVKRKNKPLQDRFWIPGGRVLKGESMETAATRKVKEELGIDIKNLKPIGYFEEHFKENDNEFGVSSGVHTVSIVFSAEPISLDIKLDKQSSEWKLFESLPKDCKIKPFNIKNI